MKNLIFFSIIIFIFLSCEKKTDLTPVTPVLKGFVTESTSLRRTVKSTYSLIYSNDKFSNLQRIDEVREADLSLKVTPILNNIITEEATDRYKMSSDFAASINGIYIISKVENIAQKIANGYEISTAQGNALTVYFQIELNANNQVTKYSNTKIVSTDINGVRKEILQNSYYRFEFDTKGNIIKAFEKNNGASTELLSAEYTYDDKPNPYKVLRWVFRLSGVGLGLAGSESTNNVLTSKNYQQGVLFTETTGSYTYDSQTGYPLTLTTLGKSNDPNVSVTPSKTTYKY
ncbi:MAG: hypothetical protein RLZZ306_3252 [Bacteroidota bacterium]|jgi:hypothetical protein